MQNELKSLNRFIYKLLLLYGVAGGLWVVISDWLISQFVMSLPVSNKVEMVQTLQTLKDWIFVALTMLWLYQVLRWQLQLLYRRYHLLNTIVEEASDSIYIKDHQGAYLMLNQICAQRIGLPIEEVLGKTDDQILPPEISTPFMQNDKVVLQTGKALTIEEPMYAVIQLSNKNPYFDHQGKVIGIVGVSKDITEYHHLLEELRIQKEDLAALKSVTENSISTLNTNELLNVLLQRIVEVMHVDSAVILLNESNSLLVVGACIGMELEVASEYPIPIGLGYAGMIAKTMKPLYIEDTEQSPLLANTLIRERGTKTLLGVPLKRQGVLVGVLHVGWRSHHPRSDRELRLLEITAERSCMSIVNARLYEEANHLSRRLQLQIDRMPIAQIIWDERCRFRDWNPAAEQVFGYTKAEVLGNSYKLLTLDHSLRELIQRALAGDMTAHQEMENLTKDKKIITCEWHNTPITNAEGKVVGIISMVQNISDRKQAELQIQNLAFYDPLTQLPNQTLFLDRLRKTSHSSYQNFAVLLLEVENYQLVKYSLGHEVADLLLLAMVQRLKACISPKQTLARVSSQEFAILLSSIDDPREAVKLAELIQQQFSTPLQLQGYEVFSSISIGICLGNRPALSTPNHLSPGPLSTAPRPQDWFRAADTAMHHAKLRGRGQHAVFDLAMHEQAIGRLNLETDLRRAIEQQQLQAYYQPIVSLSTGIITGFETLVRWQHPTKGWISPSEFIPIAEEAGWIGLIDNYIIRQACRQLSQWQSQFPSIALQVSANLSIQELRQENLIALLRDILQESQINPGSLKLEITETCLMENAESALPVFFEMRRLGLQLLIDDFGTGYSSLARLHQLPINTLKIDRFFINQMEAQKESLEIVKTIINLAHGLGMDVIAEGIETSSQLYGLQSLGCDYGQGFLFAKPLSSLQATELLSQVFTHQKNLTSSPLWTLR
jgi:PAS domain S-box-containing protein/diguanylate cyclase (GGDEF)-like protein